MTGRGAGALDEQRDRGIVCGFPVLLLRSEGGVLFALSLLLYAQSDASWPLYVVLLLAPDLAMVGYLGGTRAGAVAYNLVHTYLPPATLAVVGAIAESRPAYAGALIWFGHIGMDRLLGYGLKYPSGFAHTHLGRIGGRWRREEVDRR